MENVIRYMNKWLIDYFKPLPVSIGQPVNYGTLAAYVKVHSDYAKSIKWRRNSKGTYTKVEEVRFHIELYSKESNLYALKDRVTAFLDNLNHKFTLEDGTIVTIPEDPDAHFLDLEEAKKADIIFTLRKEEP